MGRVDHKAAEIASRTPEFMAAEATKPFGWEAHHWVRWATVTEALRRLGVPAGARVLDVGCGPGWTSLFLAEAGFDVLAVDLVPANVELTAARAARWGARVEARVADMEGLELGEAFPLVLLFDALHHAGDQRAALRSVAGHVAPGGWALFSEPSWLHDLSPHAAATARELGWRERGVRLRWLRRELRACGLGGFRRFFQPTDPYEGHGRELLWQLARLVAANLLAAPRAANVLAARRDGQSRASSE